MKKRVGSCEMIFQLETTAISSQNLNWHQRTTVTDYPPSQCLHVSNLSVERGLTMARVSTITILCKAGACRVDYEHRTNLNEVLDEITR